MSIQTEETTQAPLAVNGGQPVRRTPLPHAWCGAHHMDEQEVEAVVRVVRAKSPFRYYGPDLQGEVAKLEKEFAAYVGSDFAQAINSATGGLQVALGAVGIGPGDEVIVPGFFWVQTVSAVVRSGAIPILADCDDTFSLDPADAERKITSRTKAILTVHMAGVIGRVTELVPLARRHGIVLIEDCAQAAGVSQHGRKAGTFGDIGVFSFQMNKHMTTGEGGMVVTSDRKLYRRAMAIHDAGYCRQDGQFATRGPDDNVRLWGIGVRMNEMTGAVARVQLSKLDKICACMRTAKYRIRETLAAFAHIQLRQVIDPQGDGGSFLYVTLPKREAALSMARAMTAEGIPMQHLEDFGMHIYYNVPSLVNKLGISAKSVWDLAENQASQASYDKGTCPHLDDLLSRTILMSVPSALQPADLDDICRAFAKVCPQLLKGSVPC